MTAMPDDAPLCIHCHKPVDLEKKDYVIAIRATMRIGTVSSGFYAHHDCQHKTEHPAGDDEQAHPHE